MNTDVKCQPDTNLQTDVYDVHTYEIHECDHPAKGWAVQVDLCGHDADFTLIEDFGYDTRRDAHAAGSEKLAALHRGLNRAWGTSFAPLQRPGVDRGIGACLRLLSPDHIRDLIRLGLEPTKPKLSDRPKFEQAQDAVAHFAEYIANSDCITDKAEVARLGFHFRDALGAALAKRNR